MGEMPKDDVRVGALSLAQRMEGGFNVGVGLLQLLGVAMGGRQPSAPGQWQGKPLNCVDSLMVADGREQVGRQIDVGHGKRGRGENRDEGRGLISSEQSREGRRREPSQKGEWG